MPIRWNSHFGVMLFLLIAITSSAAERDFLPKQPWADLLQMDLSTTSLSKKQTQAARKEIWQVYSEAVKGDPRRDGEHRDKAIFFKGKTMHYAYTTVGKPGDNGYPLYIARHGGGGGPGRDGYRAFDFHPVKFNRRLTSLFQHIAGTVDLASVQDFRWQDIGRKPVRAVEVKRFARCHRHVAFDPSKFARRNFDFGYPRRILYAAALWQFRLSGVKRVETEPQRFAVGTGFGLCIGQQFHAVDA